MTKAGPDFDAMRLQAEAQAASPHGVWERVDEQLDRREVPGGWLYKTWNHYGLAMTFVPAPPPKKLPEQFTLEIDSDGRSRIIP